MIRFRWWLIRAQSIDFLGTLLGVSVSEWVCVQVHPRESDCEFSSITLSIVQNIWRISLPDGTTEPGEDKFFSALLVWIKDLSWDLRMTGSPSPALVNYVMCTTAARRNTRLLSVSTKTAEDFIWGIREWKVGERDGEMGREGGRCVCERCVLGMSKLWRDQTISGMLSAACIRSEAPSHQARHTCNKKSG